MNSPTNGPPRNKDTITMALKCCSISFSSFMKKLYERLGMNQKEIELKISYLPCITCDKFSPFTLRGDESLSYLYVHGENNYIIGLCVELINDILKRMKTKKNKGYQTSTLVVTSTSRKMISMNLVHQTTAMQISIMVICIPPHRHNDISSVSIVLIASTVTMFSKGRFGDFKRL